MSRPKRREQEPLFDPELAELPDGPRWSEWLGPVEAAIFASPTPAPREALARLVGKDCNLDDLLSDIRDELRARPYELVQVAGGWQMRTKARYADAIRALNIGARDAGPPELTPTELLTVTTIAYLQPATRAELSRLVGKEVSRDTIGRLKSLDLIAAGPRDLPDIERLEDAGLLRRPSTGMDFDGVLGIGEDAVELAEEFEDD
jgi:chromosome segregation and condensation protein ScpB